MEDTLSGDFFHNDHRSFMILFMMMVLVLPDGGALVLIAPNDDFNHTMSGIRDLLVMVVVVLLMVMLLMVVVMLLMVLVTMTMVITVLMLTMMATMTGSGAGELF